MIENKIDVEIKKHKSMFSRHNQPSYKPKLTTRDTEMAITEIKFKFQHYLSTALNLERKTSSLFVLSDSGLNDTLNGIERPVNFQVLTGATMEIVHSLAKWKRMTLKKMNMEFGRGIYTDMNAIRRDEELSPIHSYYVDQWDWEKVIDSKDRNLEFLRSTVRQIYSAILQLERYLATKYPTLGSTLPEEITFVSSQELEDTYPELSPKEREHAICRKHKAVFLTQVGKVLKSGTVHDKRAPDYDDWELNGDILLYYEELDIGLELSSMGIRVDAAALKSQLTHLDKQDYMKYEYHRMIANNDMPLTIGGGIGQSRLCMFMLKKVHIGEVQSSVWPEELKTICEEFGVHFL